MPHANVLRNAHDTKLRPRTFIAAKQVAANCRRADILNRLSVTQDGRKSTRAHIVIQAFSSGQFLNFVLGEFGNALGTVINFAIPLHPFFLIHYGITVNS